MHREDGQPQEVMNRTVPSDLRQPESPKAAVRGAMTAWGLKDTSSRPPKDLGGTLRRTSKTTLRSYDSRASGDRECPHRQGRVANVASINQTTIQLPYRLTGKHILSILSVRLLFYFGILCAEEVLIMSMSISQKDAYGMVFSNYPDIVSVAQMSKILGISEKSAYRLLQENSIEHFRVGRTYKIPKLHILNYLHIIRRS